MKFTKLFIIIILTLLVVWVALGGSESWRMLIIIVLLSAITSFIRGLKQNKLIENKIYNRIVISTRLLYLSITLLFIAFISKNTIKEVMFICSVMVFFSYIIYYRLYNKCPYCNSRLPLRVYIRKNSEQNLCPYCNGESNN